MSLTSIHFFMYLALLFVLYFTLPKRWQWIVLLIFSFIFYASAGAKYLIFIILAIGIVYWLALCIDTLNWRTKFVMKGGGDSSPVAREYIREYSTCLKKVWYFGGISIVLGTWAVLKFWNFFALNFNALLSIFRIDFFIAPVDWILPLGISFYSFHAVGYLTDVYRGKYAAERNFFKFALFISFFPHIVQGPFSRYDHLHKTLYVEHSFSYIRFYEGCYRIIWGLFKKFLIADKLEIPVSILFSNYLKYSGTHILLAIIFYTIQIYADFSGYMDIVCGISHILGVELAENFRQPYFSKSVEEFWRRWHITLGQWFRDYIFYPVSMSSTSQKIGFKSRKFVGARTGKLIPGYIALVFVWISTGLWHGAEWKYIMWGCLNLLAIMSSIQLEPMYNFAKKICHINSEGTLWKLFCITRTLCVISVFHMLERSNSVKEAMVMLRRLITNFDFSILTSPRRFFVGSGLTGMELKGLRELIVIIVAVLFLFTYDILRESNRWDNIKKRCPIVVSNLILVLMIFSLILFAGDDTTKGFMYAQY